MPAGISDLVLAAKMAYHYIEADADLPTRTVDRPDRGPIRPQGSAIHFDV